MDTAAANGSLGTLLLDPKNIIIATSGGSAYAANSNNRFADSAGLTTILTPASLVINADVTLQANNDVTFTDAVNMSNNNRNLTVQAGRNININNNVSVDGNVTMTANDSNAQSANRDAGTGSITMANNTSLTATGNNHNVTLTVGSSTSSPFAPGSITLGSVSATGDRITVNSAGAANTVTQTASSSITSNELLLTGPSSFTLNNSTNNVANIAANNTGAVAYTDADSLNVTTVNGVNGITTSNAAVNVKAGSGSLTVNQGISSGNGNVTLTADGDVNLNSANSDITTTGSLTVNADNNANGSGDFIQATNSAISAASASITAANYQSTGTTNVGSGNVTLKTSTASSQIGLGSNDYDFNVSDAELDNITAGSLTVGSATNTGGIFSGNDENVTLGSKNVNLVTAGTVTLEGSNNFVTTGDVSVTANDLAIGTGSTLQGNNVTLQANDATDTIGVGATAGTFTVTDAELDRITASNLLTIGSVSNTGGVTVDGISSNNALKFISGGNITLKNAISTANKAIEFLGNIVLGANTNITTSGANAKLNGAVTGGGNSLTVNTGAGNADVTGNASGLSSASVTGANINLKSVTTTGAQSYTGATTVDGTYQSTGTGTITVNGNLTVGGGTTFQTAGTAADDITVTGTIDGVSAGAQNLQFIAGLGDVQLQGAVGAGVQLGALTVNSAGIFSASSSINAASTNVSATNDIQLKNVTTSGSQSYTGTTKTTLGGNLQATGAGSSITVNGNAVIADTDSNSSTVDTVTVTTNNGAVSFNNKLDGTQNYKQAISVSAGNGAVTFADSIGSIVPLYGMTVNTTGAQIYPAVMNLLNLTIQNLVLTADKNITLGAGTLTVGNVTGNNYNLTLVADEIDFNGGADSVTGTGNLVLRAYTDSLKTVLAGSTENSGQLDLTTTDLGALKDGFNSITFGGLTSTGGIDINAYTFKDAVVFDQALNTGGDINVLGTLKTSGSASTITLNGSGHTTDLSADIVTAGADIYINDSVKLLNSVTLNTTDGGAPGANITVTGNVNAASSGVQSLALTAGTGNTDLQGNVGTTSLNTLTVNSANTARFGGSVTSNGSQSITASTIQTNGALTTTTAGSSVSLNGNVALQNNSSVNTNNGDITVTGTVDGAKSLTLGAGSGSIDLQQAVGGTTPLTALTVNSANVARFGGNVTTSGNQAVTATTIRTNGTHQTTGAGNTIALTGNTELQNDTTLTTNGGNVTATGTINGAKNLIVNAGAGNVDLQSAVGGAAALTGVTATGANIGLRAVKTTGSQSYTGVTTLNGNLQSTTAGSITVTGNTTLAGDAAVTTAGLAGTDDITFTGTINGAKNLVLNSGLGDVLVGGSAGQTLSLLSLAATGATVDVQAVKTTGVQSYTGATTLNGDLTATDSGTTINLNGNTTLGNNVNLSTNNGNITAAGTIDGAKTLGITAGTGNVDLQSNVGSGAALNALTVNSANIARFGGNVTTTGNQAVTATTIQTNGTHQTTGAGSAITLTGNTTLQNNTQLTTNDGNVTATGTIDGAKTLGITVGTGSVNLQSNVGSSSALSALTVTNAGTARFGGNVTTSGNQDIKATAIQTNGTHQTTGAGSFAKFDGNTTLQNNTAVTTNNGDITFTGTVDGAKSLSLNAGSTGNVALQGNVGGSNPLTFITAIANKIGLKGVKTTGSQTYTAADTVTGTTLGGDLQSTSAGNITINGQTTIADLDANAATIDNVNVITNGGNVTFNGKTSGTVHQKQSLSVDAGAGNIAFNDSIGVPVALNTLSLANTGTQTLPATVNVLNLTLSALNLSTDTVLNLGVGTISLGNVSAGSFNLTLIADEINFTGGANTVIGTGSLILQAFTNALKIVTGGATNANPELELTTTDLDAIKDGFNLITIGSLASTGGIDINAYTFKDAITFDQAAGTGGAINVLGTLASTGTNSDITINGSGNTTHLSADVVTSGADITINDSVELVNGVTLDTTNSGGVAAGANVTVTGQTNSAAATHQNLTVKAGTAGNVDLQGNVGATDSLDTLTVSGANSARFGGAVTTENAQSITAGTIVLNDVHTVNTSAQTIDLNGNVSLENNATLATTDGDVTVTGTINGAKGLVVDAGTANVDFQSAIGNTTALNTLAVANAGSVAFGGNVTTTGNQNVSATDIFTNGTHQTTGAGSQILLGGNVTLSGDTALQTNNGDVTVTGTVDGAQSLAVTAGTGTADLQQNVGSNTALSSVTVNSANVARFGGDVTTTGNQSLTASTIRTNGTHQVTGAGNTISLIGNTELQNTTQLTTNDGNVTATGTINGAQDLGVTAGTGNVDLQQNVGNTAALSSLSVNSANTARFGADVTTTGNQSVTASAIQTNGKHEVTGAGNTITLNGPVTLQNDTTLKTNDGNIDVNGTVNGANDLTLEAGAGDITTGGVIGGVNRLAALLVKSAKDWTANQSIFANSIAQDAGTGTTTVHGDLNTNGVDGIELVGNNFLIGDDATDFVRTTNGGGFCVTNAGTYTLNSSLDLSGEFCQLGAGDFNLNTDIITDNADITFAGNVTLGGNTTLQAGTATIWFKSGSELNTAGFDTTLTADEIDLEGGNNSVYGGGNLTLRAFTNSLDTNIGGAVNTNPALDLTQTDITALTDGTNPQFNSVTIGRNGGTGTMTVVADSTFYDPTTFFANGPGASMHVNGDILGMDTVNNDSSISIFGSHATTHLNADIITAGANIFIDDKVIVESNVTLDTTNSGGAAAGADIEITDNVDGKTVAGQDLTIKAGTTGDVKLDDAIGATTRLGNLDIQSGENVTASDITAKTIKTNTEAAGTTNFNGKLDTIGAAGVDVNGGVFNFNDSVTTANNGGVSVTNAGQLTIVGDMDLDGAFLQDGAGLVSTSVDIVTTADDITFTTAVTLTGNAKFSTGAGIGDIWFKDTVDSDNMATRRNLTLASGAGSVKLDGNVGSTAALDAFVISSANDVTALGTIDATSLQQSAGTGTSRFDGAITTDGSTGIDLVGKNFTLNGLVTATNGDMHVTNSGVLTLNNDVNLTNAFVQDGLGQTVLNGDITTNNALISFHAPVILGKSGVVDAFTLTSGGSAINFDGTIDGASNGEQSLVLNSGSGNIVLGGAIGLSVGRRLADLIITAANDVTASAAIKAGTIQQTAGTGTTTFNGAIDTNGAGGVDLNGTHFAFNAPVITTSGGGVTVTNSGTLNIGPNGDMVLDGAFLQDGAGDVFTAGDITTTGDAITFNGPVTLTNNVTLNTTNGVAAGNNITFNNTLLALAAGVQGLNINAGTAGDVLFAMTVGSIAQRLGNLTITTADQVTFNDAVKAASVRQVGAGASGNTIFNGAVDTDTLTGIDLTGQSFTFNDDVTTTNNGGVSVTNAGTFSINNGKTLTLDGAFVQDGTGANNLNGNIKTTGDQILYTSATTLTGASSLDSTFGGFPAGAQISFISTLDGNNDLTVQSGLAQTLFNDNVGTGSRLGDGTGASLILNSKGTATFNGDLNTNSGITAANGPVVFNGNVSAGTGASGDTASTFNKDVTFNTGLAGKTASFEDGATFGQFAQNNHVNLTGSSLALSSTDSNLLFNSDVNGATNLSLNAGAGATTFKEAVGSSTALGTGTGAAIAIASTGTTLFEKTVQANSGISAADNTNVRFNDNVTLANGDTGSSFLGNVIFDGMTYSGFDGFQFGDAATDTVTLSGGSVSLVSNNGNVTSTSIVDGAQALSVTAGSGDVDFQSAVGSVTPLSSLTVVSSDETRFGANVTTSGSQTVTANTIKTNATNESTAGNIQLNGNLELENDTTLKTDASAGGNVTVTGTTNGAKNLDVLANAATVSFQGNVGGTTALTSLDVTNTGGTTRFGGNVKTTGAQNVTSNLIQTNGTHQTTDASTAPITFTGTTELQSNTTFLTNGSDVTFNGNIIDAFENLTFNVGAGDVNVNGNIGASGAEIGQLHIVMVDDFTVTGDTFAQSILQDASALDGLTWFKGNISTIGAAGINLTANDITIGTAPHAQTVTATNGGGFTAKHDPNSTGVLTIYSDMFLDGPFTDLGTGPSNIFGNITTGSPSGDVLFAGDLLLGGDVVITSAGDITFLGFVDGSTASGADDLTLTAGDDITFAKTVGGGNVAGSVFRLGVLKINSADDVTLNQTAGPAIGSALTSVGFKQLAGTGTTQINGVDGLLDVTSGNGVDLTGNNFVFQNGAIDVDFTGSMKVVGNDITFTAAPVFLNSTAGSGNLTLTNSGVLTFDSNSDVIIYGGGSFLQNGNGTAFTGSDITTFGGAITWNDPTLTNDVTMISGGGNISFFDHIDSDGTPRTLTLDAGNTGNILFDANIGAVSALGDLDIVNANDVTANGSIAANSVTQEAGQGTTTLNGAVLTTGDNGSVAGGSGNGDGVELNGSNFNLNNTITTQNGGNVEINNSGTLNIAAAGDMNLDGTFTQFGGGAVNTAGDIVTTGDDIFFTDAVILTGNVLMSMGAGPGTITFNSNVNATTAGVEDLTLTAGTGNVLFNQSIGGTTRLGDVLITSANDVKANDSIFAASLTQNAGTGTSRFIGNVDTNTAQGVDLTGNNFQFDANVLAANGKVNVDGTGTVIVGDALADSMQADQAITLRGDTITLNSTLESDADLAGGEGISITADRQAASDILAHNTITSHGGNIDMSANNDVLFDAIADVASNNGNVTVTADKDGDQTGALTMEYLPTDRAEIVSGTGKIALKSGEDVTLGGLTTTNSGADAAKVTSTNGLILDGGESVNGTLLFDIDARNGGVQLDAKHGIGTGSNGALEIWTSKLSATSFDGNINVDLNDPLVQGIDAAVGAGPVTVTNASVTGGTGTITIRQLADAPMTVNNASTFDGAINFLSIDDLIVTNQITAGGPSGAVNLTADAAPGQNGDGDLVINPAAVVTSSGSVNMSGVNVLLLGQVFANTIATVLGNLDVLLGYVQANTFNIATGRNIIDANGDATNLVGNETSFLSAGGVIGSFNDAIEVVLKIGDLILTAGSSSNGISANIYGSIFGDVKSNLTDGLVLFNQHAIAGAPITTFNTSLQSITNLIAQDRWTNGMEDLQHNAALQRGTGLRPGLENPFVPTVETGRFTQAPNVVVNEKQSRLWKRKVRPVAPKPVVPAPAPVTPIIPTPEVAKPVQPVVVPAVKPAVKPAAALPVIPTPVVSKPAPVVPAVKPAAPVVKPVAVAPAQVPAVRPAVKAQPTWVQQAQSWFRTNVQGQSGLQPLPTGNRLFQQNVEEAPRTEKAKDEAKK